MASIAGRNVADREDGEASDRAIKVPARRTLPRKRPLQKIEKIHRFVAVLGSSKILVVIYFL